MSRVAYLSALIMLCAALVSSAFADSSAKAFPAGCWIGKSKYSGKSDIGPAKGAVSEGTQSLVLWVGPQGLAFGSLLVTGNATGTFEVAGSALAAEMKLRGEYDLSGTAAKVKVDGTYSITGTARGTGQLSGTFPIKLKLPVNGTLVVKTVSPNRVTGQFRKAPWSATRRAGTPSKNAQKCFGA